MLHRIVTGGGSEMITYEVTCFCCRKKFLVQEGTKEYQLYKRNRNGKYACEACNNKIYLEARKILFSKLF